MRGTRWRHGTGPEAVSLPGSAAGNAVSSAAVMPGCRRGSSWKYRHHSAAQTAEHKPSTTKETRQENQAIRRATIGADAPAPRRPAACVIPTATPREASEVQLDNARVAAGKVAPSPMPSTRRTENSEASPPTAPVTIVVIDQVSPQTARVRLAPKRSASHPPTS